MWERSINWLPPVCARTRDQTCNLGKCPELNPQPFDYGMTFQSFLMFDCPAVLTRMSAPWRLRFLSGLSSAASPQLAHSKCSLNICSVVRVTWSKNKMAWAGGVGGVGLEYLVLGAGGMLGDVLQASGNVLLELRSQLWGLFRWGRGVRGEREREREERKTAYARGQWVPLPGSKTPPEGQGRNWESQVL